MKLFLTLIGVVLFGAWATACGGQALTIEGQAEVYSEPMVSVPRTLTEAQVRHRQALSPPSSRTRQEPTSDETFYLAIRKDQLGTRWFLSAHLKQMFPLEPGELGGGAPLGTRVVTFKLQNDKLFLLDASGGKAFSDTFMPEIVLEAWPLVHDFEPFVKAQNSDDYVLIDPAAGLNRFSIAADRYSEIQLSLSVDLSFLQRFRNISDGVTFEQVFSAHVDRPLTPANSPQENAHRVSGTLGISLRRYSEGPGFQKRPVPPSGIVGHNHYLLSRPSIVRNSGQLQSLLQHWNIHPGMAPIAWKVSPGLARVKEDPRLQGVDLSQVAMEAIESWNQAFGFRALAASVATSEESFADDDVNYLIFDEAPGQGSALGFLRANPETGEIRGATVYLGSSWLSTVDRTFNQGPAQSAPERQGNAQLAAWGPLHAERNCSLAAAEPNLTRSIAQSLTTVERKTRIAQFFRWLIAHEIGHTLGLRHNFKGSLVPPGSSVMDYVAFTETVNFSGPGSYDVAALRYLHGFSPALPDQPFCTDSDTSTDPDCARFDAAARHPLSEVHAPSYAPLLSDYLTGRSPALPEWPLQQLLSYVRNASGPEDRRLAWNTVMAQVQSPLPAPLTSAHPGYAARADGVAQKIWAGLYPTEAPAPSDPAITALALAELRLQLLNFDGWRSFTTRRMVVNIFKKMQSPQALSVLVEANGKLKALLPTLKDPDLQNAVQDLVTRIELALSPYYAS